jgi:probable rRNA maturation factor
LRISVLNQQKNLPIAAASVKAVVKEVFSLEEAQTDELSIYFVTTEEICRLHKAFFNDPSITDCISFPIDLPGETHTGYHVLGEIFICPQTAIDYLLTQGKDENAYQETTLYLVHGLLHLLGYDDVEKSDEQAMRTSENRHMQHLLAKDLLLH